MAEKYKKIVIVTGGSSGIGRCTASALRDNGCIVYEFSRRNIPMEGIRSISTIQLHSSFMYSTAFSTASAISVQKFPLLRISLAKYNMSV